MKRRRQRSCDHPDAASRSIGGGQRVVAPGQDADAYKAWAIFVLAPVLFALPMAAAKAEPDVMLYGQGRFSSDRIWKSTVGDPCDMGGPTYYENPAWTGNQDRFYPQSQCSGTGGHFPYAPQVVSCESQGYCLRFATAAGGDTWNRCEMAIADRVPIKAWHYVEFKFKLPFTIPDTRCNPGDLADSGCDPFLVQLFHQPAVTGKPRSDVIGGIRLHTSPDGSHKVWRLHIQGSYEDQWGGYFKESSDLVTRDVQPNQWVKVALYFYMDPENSSMILFSVDDSAWDVWPGPDKFGQMGYFFQGITWNLHTDMKIGVYNPPLASDLRVYIDDVLFDRYADGVINYGE